MAVLVAPGRYGVQEFARPRLEDGAALLRMEMSGICVTDKHSYRGETKQYAGTPAETDTPFAIVQGHENVGVIDEITPSAVERLEFYGQRLGVGDLVTMCPDVVCGRWLLVHEMVTHEFGLADADTAMRTSMSPESMKVTMVPSLP